MEAAGLAIGVAGLAGLFSACLDALDKVQSYRSWSSDAHTLDTQFAAEKLRFKQWGRDVGFEQGKLAEDHHAALDDAETSATIGDLLRIIYTLCGSSEHAAERPNRQGNWFHGSSSGSKKDKVAWALWGKGKREDEVNLLKDLVDKLYHLVSPESLRKAGNTEAESTSEAHSDKAHVLLEVQQFLARRENERKVELQQHLQSWLLGSSLPNNVYSEALQNRVTGTCDWIFQRQEYARWLSGASISGRSKLLWVNGPAGFGKTVLCARIVEELSATLDQPVAKFFCSSDFNSQSGSLIIICSWIFQMMLQEIEIFDLVYQAWLVQDDRTASRAVVEDLFGDSLRAVPGCTLVLDGLDECMTASGVAVLESISRVFEGTGTRFLVVSRNEPELRQALEDCGIADYEEYRISIADVRTDTASYSKSIVDQKLPNKNEAIRSDLTERMTERCDGQFLWLKMQAGHLRKGMNQNQLRRAIGATPSGLTDIYDRNWISIISYAPEERSRALSLLRWSAFSLRPLTVGEITEAVLISYEATEIPADELPDALDEDYINSEILGLCGSLLEVRKSAQDDERSCTTVHITHFSVKQYLLSRLASPGMAIGANATLQTSNEAHEDARLARLCIQYICFSQTWTPERPRAPEELSVANLGATLRDYAAGSWFRHARVATDTDDRLSTAINNFFGRTDGVWDSWKQWFDSKMYEGEGIPSEDGKQSRLHYAAELGLEGLARHLLHQMPEDRDVKGVHGRSPLLVASKFGFEPIVRLLLDAGADVYVRDQAERTPLYEAVRHGHVDIAKLLIERDADANGSNNFGWTPLNLASDDGNYELATMLLDRGADLHPATKFGTGPLHSASQSGHLEVAKLLVERGADLNAQDDSGETPLYKAAANGHASVIKFLLDKGAGLHISTTDGWTPLDVASGSGQASAARLLVQNGAKLGDTTTDRTPLHRASRDGALGAVQLLLELGADVNCLDSDGFAPLHLAAMQNHVHVARLLLENKAQCDVKSQENWGPLELAFFLKHYEVVKVLLEFGANADYSDGSTFTLLNSAVESGQRDMVKAMLDHGASVAPEPKGSIQPIHRASLAGDLDMARILLEHGADVNELTNEGTTPLRHAVDSGNFELVKLLVDAGALVQVPGMLFPPLNSAARQGLLDVVQLLLDRGADVNEASPYHTIPLGIAAEAGQIDMVKLLLARGANVSLSNLAGQSPLHAAAAGGHLEIVNILLDHGAELEQMDQRWLMATPLHLASREGHTDIVRVLVEKGASIKALTYTGWNSLAIAVSFNRHQTAKLLLDKGINLEVRTYAGYTPLMIACGDGARECVEVLLAAGADIMSLDNAGGTALYPASEAGNADIVKLLLDAGSKLTVNPPTLVPFLIASFRGHFNVVEQFLNSSSSPNVTGKDAYLRSALFLAASRGHTDLVKLLLAHGHDPLAKDYYGSTPICAALRNGHELVVQCMFNAKRPELDSPDFLSRSLRWWADRLGTDMMKDMLLGSQDPGLELQVMQNDAPWSHDMICTICTIPLLFRAARYRCKLCHGGHFVCCEDCVGLGAKCRYEDHKLEHEIGSDL